MGWPKVDQVVHLGFKPMLPPLILFEMASNNFKVFLTMLRMISHDLEWFWVGLTQSQKAWLEFDPKWIMFDFMKNLSNPFNLQKDFNLWEFIF